MKRLFAFDVDGTILTSDRKILDSTKQAIKRIIENGDVALINSGRSYEMAVGIAKEAGINELLACNGAIYYNLKTNKHLFDVYINFEDFVSLVEVIRMDDSCSINVMRLGGITLYDLQDEEWIGRLKQEYANSSIHIFKKEEYIEFLTQVKKDNDVLKVTISVQKDIDVEDLKERIRTRINPNKFHWFVNQRGLGEFTPTNVNKWTGIVEYIRHFTIDPLAVYTFGDDSNDIEMIREASHGIAMGNAVDEIKAVAHYVTTSNDEDGIAKVVNMVYEGQKLE